MSQSLTVGSGESLQAAIDRATEGTVIHLVEGTWEENLRIERSLTLRGVGQEKTVIEGREEGYPTVRIISTKEVAVRIEGLTIAGAHGECADWHRGICANGLLVQGPAQVKIIDSTVSENRKSGLFLGGEAQVEIIDSAISRNGHYGLWLMDWAQAKVSYSIISRNGFGPADGLDSARDGIALRGSAWAEIVDSTISKNGHHGLWVSASAQAEISGSTISGNKRGGIWLRDGAQARIWGNRIIDNNGYGVALYRRPCYVTSHAFSGHIWGKANIISCQREPEGNDKHTVCPEELGFLMTEEGGEYP
jgi:parallel beta-helix repeat protein